MPYTDDPGHVLADKMRFLVGDTNTARPELSDSEVDFLLSEEGGDAARAAARAAEALAAKYVKIADEKQVGPLRLTYTEKAARFTTLAKSLWRRAAASSVAPYAGGISVSDKEANEANTDRVAPALSRDMMDYPLGAPSQEDILP